MKPNWPYEFPGAYWMDKQEERAVLDVLRKGSLFRYYGLRKPRQVDGYEEAAQKFYGVKHALGVNSGTGALICSMRALGIGPGCEVVLPSFLWVATVGAVVQVGAIPVLCEVDESFTMDVADLQRKVTRRTKLIVPIHMAGTPSDMDGIMRIARKHRIAVLEDCAQCNAGTFGGRKVGTIGDMGIFSLQLNKNMTSGEGGLVITDDDRLYARAFSAHDLGMVRKGGRLAMPEADAVLWGGGRRMTEICGAIARVQLGKLPKIVGHMRSSHLRIRRMLEGAPGLTLRRLNDVKGDTGPFLIVLLEDAGRALAATAAMREAGLHNVHRLAEYGLHIYSNIPALVGKLPLSAAGEPWRLKENAESVHEYGPGACPRSDALFARSVLVPIPSCLTRGQEKDAARIIREAAAATGAK